jgi:hypothetical protein
LKVPSGSSGMTTRSRSRSPMDLTTPESAGSDQSGKKRKADGAEDEHQDKRRR